MFPPEAIPTPIQPYSPKQYALLRDFAARYMWWKTPQDAILYPDRVLAQVMNLGTYEDLGRLVTAFTTEELCGVVLRAEPGWFTERSWAFWHLRLGLIAIGALPPPLPNRTFPD